MNNGRLRGGGRNYGPSDRNQRADATPAQASVGVQGSETAARGCVGPSPLKIAHLIEASHHFSFYSYTKAKGET